MSSYFWELGLPFDTKIIVFNLNLPADLIVLSACQTGLGKEISGEGIVGLTRGFMYAGSPRVVVSLWSVDDAQTAKLMSKFYRGVLAKGLTPAAALRQAQLEMHKEGLSPYYWAPFTIQGEWNQTSPQRLSCVACFREAVEMSLEIWRFLR
jgi:CHAT domain-containing protein